MLLASNNELAVALNVMLADEGSTSSEPKIGPTWAPLSLMSGTISRPGPKRERSPTTKGLLKVAVKPVGVGVNAVTVRPRVLMGLLMPVMVGFVDAVSVALMV